MKSILGFASAVIVLVTATCAYGAGRINADVSQFSTSQLHEPFTLMYRVVGPNETNCPIFSTVAISTSAGSLLYILRSAGIARQTVAIYDGHETYSTGLLGNAEAEIEPGFCFDQFGSMPLPAVGLPYPQIARRSLPLARFSGASQVQIRQILQRGQQPVPAIYRGKDVQEDLETVPGLGYINTNKGTDLNSVPYGIRSIGWVAGRLPVILWLSVLQGNLTPLYSWTYPKHVTFEGQSLASEIQSKRFPGAGSKSRTSCTVELMSASESAMPAGSYSLDHYILGHASVEDHTKTPEVAFQYSPREGSLEDQEIRSTLLEETQAGWIYVGRGGGTADPVSL